MDGWMMMMMTTMTMTLPIYSSVVKKDHGTSFHSRLNGSSIEGPTGAAWGARGELSLRLPPRREDASGSGKDAASATLAQTLE